MVYGGWGSIDGNMNWLVAGRALVRLKRRGRPARPIMASNGDPANVIVATSLLTGNQVHAIGEWHLRLSHFHKTSFDYNWSRLSLLNVPSGSGRVRGDASFNVPTSFFVCLSADFMFDLDNLSVCVLILACKLDTCPFFRYLNQLRLTNIHVYEIFSLCRFCVRCSTSFREKTMTFFGVPLKQHILKCFVQFI